MKERFKVLPYIINKEQKKIDYQKGKNEIIYHY